MTAKTLTLRLLGAVGLGVVFVLAAGVAPILHLDLPAGRRALAALFTSALNDTFLGKFEIAAIERVDVSGLVARGVVVRDPAGKRVLSVTRLRAQADLPALVQALLFGGEKITLVIDHVHIDHAEARLRPDPKTQIPSIAKAFTPRPSASKAPKTPGRHVRVVVQAVELTHGFVRGKVLGLQTVELDLSSVRGSVRATPVGAEVSVNRFGATLRGLRGADLKGIASVRLRAPGWLWTSFDGHFGDVQLGALLRLDGDQIMAALEVPKAAPPAMRALLPGYPLREDANLAFEAAGKLPIVTLQGRLQAGDGLLLVTGPVRLDTPARAELEVDGKNVDLRLAIPKAPATQLDLRANVQVSGAETPPIVRFDAITEPTRIEGLDVPAVDLSAALQGGKLEGHALLHEPGLPTRARFRVEPSGHATIRAEAPRVRIERAPRLAALLPVTGVANLTVGLDIQDGKVRGDLNADLEQIRAGELHVARGALSGRIAGELGRPRALELDAALVGTSLDLAELRFERAGVKITGPITRPLVRATLSNRDGPNVLAEARVEPRADRVRITGLSMAVRREDAELVARAGAVDVAEKTIALRDIDLRGLGGSLRGSARMTPDLLSVQATGRALNLGALTRLLGLSARPRGMVNIDADVELARDVERGTLHVELTDGVLGALDGLSATLDAELARGNLAANARAELAQVGVLNANLRGELGGSARDPRSFRDMLGEAELSLVEADLGLLGAALAAQGTLDGLAGKLTARAHFTRKDPRALPSLALTGFTQGIRVVLPQSESSPSPPAARSIEGVNLLFSAEIDGEGGETELNAQLVDARGALALGSLSSTVDLAAARRAPEALFEQLTHTKLLGKLVVSERSIGDLPAVFQPPGVGGQLRAEATLAGSLAAPEVTGRLSIGAFGLTRARNQRPVDVCATVTWEPVVSRLLSTGEAFLSGPGRARCSAERVLRYSVNGTVGRRPGGALVPRGTATLALEGFPLDAVPGLGDAGVSGQSFGTISLADTDGVPRLSASVDLRAAEVQGVPIGTGKLRIQSDARSLGANLALTHEGGELKATALAALDRSGAIPQIDTKQPMFFRVTAARVGAVVLSPLVKDVLSEIGGRVNADVSATLVAQPTPENPDKLAGSIQGHVALEDGNVQLAGLGLRLSDVSLKARAESVGNLTRISIDELGGIGGRSSDRVRLADGRLWLDGVRVIRAEGNFIPEELPLMLEGVPQATARTRQPIPFRLERQADRMYVVFNVPYLSVALPQSTGRNVIGLDENDSIELLQPLGEPIRRSGDGIPWLVRFELGQNVRITRADLDLPITGTAEVLLADRVSVTGDLDLIPGGRLQLSDNQFIIESGEVHFNTGDPANPSIRVTANWRAPDDTVVFLTVTGTLKEPKLEDPTSSPPKTKEEIWALLVGFGGTTDETATPSAAGALVGAQQLLSPFLQNTVARKISLRAKESEKADRSYTTYTAAIPIGDKIWFEGSYHMPTANESDEYQDAVSGTVDWRFRPHWSLRTEVGTIGTGLDLVWQYRY
jgi:hypothetical protein